MFALDLHRARFARLGVIRELDVAGRSLDSLRLVQARLDAFHLLDVEVHDVPLVFFAETARGKTTLSAVGRT